ncbi:hypothetical protein DE146DRAFT_607264 [Phaeosphaeria sp. MPI-PUGE-AT-0046c]|nr:hypothetical protein DE146DRAFT_607264 [Phaeosphaeria sp. MPI-PUGE-AT-0046c]
MAINYLHNSDLKKLTRILRGIPSHCSLKSLIYSGSVKKGIKALPSNLRQSSTRRTYILCPTHAGLNGTLIDGIWHCMQNELSAVLGKFVLPLLMCRKLTSAQELAIRQLEPVGEMFDEGFSAEAATPECRPRQSINAGKKWAYQADQCPACMLARIGSDTPVLLALYAGMIGHFPTYKLASRPINYEDLSPAALDNPKSKRVRFVRYWLKECNNGDALYRDAVELGIVLKKAYKDLKAERKAMKQQEKQGGWSLAGESVSVEESDLFRDEHHVENLQRQPPKHALQHTSSSDPKLGPQPRSACLNPRSPAEALGFKFQSGYRDSKESQRPLLDPESEGDPDFEFEYDGGNATIYPGDSISIAPPRSQYTSKQPSASPIPSPFVHGDPFKNPARYERGKKGGRESSGAGTEWGNMY